MNAAGTQRRLAKNVQEWVLTRLAAVNRLIVLTNLSHHIARHRKASPRRVVLSKEAPSLCPLCNSLDGQGLKSRRCLYRG